MDGSTGWDSASYPSASGNRDWIQNGHGETVTVTIDVADATLTRFVWANFTVHSHWVVNTTDAEDHKLTFMGSSGGWRQIQVRDSRQSITINVRGDVRVGNGGSLAPGDSIGTLSIDGGLTLADGSGIEWEFQSAAIYDRFEADSLTLDGGAGITITIRNPGAINIEEGDRFTLFDNPVFGYARDSFTLVNESDWAGGFDIEEGSLVLVAIPEPGLGSLLLIGGALLGLRRRYQA